jgi:hypothetical protein
MITNIKILKIACLLVISTLVAGCEPILEGCTDSEATNYNSRATDDDGSCKYCDGKGTLRLTNASAVTQKINIDGANYGYLYAGNTAYFQLAVGTHTYTFQNGTGGGNACSPATVIIVACQTEGFSCSG